MNIRSKIVLRFLLAFLIGAVLGAAVNRILVRQHIRSIFEMRSRGFMNPFRDEILKRTPEGSRSAMEALLETHGRYLTEIDVRFRAEIEASFKDLMRDMATILPADKLKEIESFLQAPPPPPGKPGDPRRFPGQPPRDFGRPNGPPGRLNPPDQAAPPERRF